MPLYKPQRPSHSIRQLFKGKPAERWGRKTTGLRGFRRKPDDSGVASESQSARAHAEPPGFVPPTAFLKLTSGGKHMVNKVIDPRGADSSGMYRRPGLVLRLKRSEDLPSLLDKAKSYPSPVRMVGADYSQTRCVGGDGGTTVDTSGLDKILEYGEDTVRAQAGVRVGTLARALAERGQELLLTPEMGNISVGALAVTTCPQAS